MNVLRWAGEFAFRPGWADTASAGAVRPRNCLKGTKGPKGRHSKMRRVYSTCVGLSGLWFMRGQTPVAHATGRGCVGLPGLNRTRIASTSCVFTVQKSLTALPSPPVENV